MSTRVFTGGMADLLGMKIGTLVVGDIVSRNPAPRWSVTCDKCGSSGTESHAVLMGGGARCRNAGCIKAGLREELNMTPAKARRRDADATAARNREREQTTRIALSAAEQELQETSNKIMRTVRARVSTMADDEVYVDPSTVGISMTQEAAAAFNKEQAALYRRNHPEYHATSANVQAIIGYLQRNGIQIASEKTYDAAVRRLDSLALLEHASTSPAPQAQPQKPYVNLSVAPAEPEPTPRAHTGVDLETGLERSYSDREIALLTAQEFKRVFALNRLPDSENQAYAREWAR